VCVFVDCEYNTPSHVGQTIMDTLSKEIL